LQGAGARSGARSALRDLGNNPDTLALLRQRETSYYCHRVPRAPLDALSHAFPKFPLPQLRQSFAGHLPPARSALDIAGAPCHPSGSCSPCVTRFGS